MPVEVGKWRGIDQFGFGVVQSKCTCRSGSRLNVGPDNAAGHSSAQMHPRALNPSSGALYARSDVARGTRRALRPQP